MQPPEMDISHDPEDSDPAKRSDKDPFAPWAKSRHDGIRKGTHRVTGQVKWRVRYRPNPNARQTSRTFDRLEDAKRFRNEQQELAQAHRDGRRTLPAPRRTESFERWTSERFIAVRTNPRTVAAYQDRLEAIRIVDPEFLRLPIGMVGKSDVERLVARLVRYPYGNNYVNNIKFLVMGVLHAAAENGHIAPPSFKIPNLPKPPRKATPAHDELLAIVAAAPPWHQALLATAAVLGLRSGEVRGLTLEAIDGLGHSLRDGWVYSPDPFSWEIRIYRQLLGDGRTMAPTKGSKHREVYPDEAALSVITTHLNTYGPGPYGLVFQRFTSGGRPLGRGLSHHSLQHAIERASMRGVGRAFTSHSLRRFHVTTRLLTGEQVKQVSDDIGHSNTELTQQIYNDLMRRQRERGAAFAQVASAVGSAPVAAAVMQHPTATGR